MSKNDITIVVGYSLEAAVVARKLANEGHPIIFARTGEFGHGLDERNEVITKSSYAKLIDTEVDCAFDSIYAHSYLHIPYKELRIVNDMNGLISYPFNKTSFGTAEEWEEVVALADKLFSIKLKAKTANNYMNIHKKIIPRWLYESVINNIAMNKWKVKHSQLTKDAIYKEMNFKHIHSPSPEVVYRPTGGYTKLIEKLLDHDNIEIKDADLDKIRESVRKPYRDKYMLIMDNRIDYILNYMAGKLDRIKLHVDEIDDKSQMDEYRCVDNAFILTPSKDYWMTSSFDGNDVLVYSEEIEYITSSIRTELIPSVTNAKMLYEYQKIIQRFPNKQFILPTSLTFGM